MDGDARRSLSSGRLNGCDASNCSLALKRAPGALADGDGHEEVGDCCACNDNDADVHLHGDAAGSECTASLSDMSF